ncbi:MAG: NAD(P)/FAD-dependent oxidoreductase [Acidimicrobiia bacterium]|nr:NAD(P)/FAD-dependent oxidoreductase [Acidimicrobiia bacterium]
MSEVDAIVVGAGPNGLAAAVRLGQEGRRVLVIEGADTVGGGTRTAELTLPGFRHDTCSAVHPFGVASPYFRSLPLEKHGLRWIEPGVAVAHPLDDGRAVIGQRSLEATAAELGADGRAFSRLLAPTIEHADAVFADVMRPLLRVPRHPLSTGRFGLRALRSAKGLVGRFKSDEAKAYFAGHSAHNTTPLDSPASAATGLALAVAVHAYGWPIAAGGSQAISDALAGLVAELGGSIETGRWVSSLSELPSAEIVMLDVAPRGLLQLAGDRLSDAYSSQLRSWKHGPAAFKVDWALDGPIPWTNPRVGSAGTVHVGGTFSEIAAAEEAAWNGDHAERPFMIVAQQSVADPSRAPEGKHTAWGYCHVPNGSTEDMVERMELQMERFAPGFRDLVLQRAVMTPAELETYNPNYVGGEIIGGASTLRQIVARPRLRPSPYRTPLAGVYLCSASTPPGAGVHGMCGFWAAETALSDLG